MSTHRENKNRFSHFKALMGRNLQNKYLRIACWCVLYLTALSISDSSRHGVICVAMKMLGVNGFAKSCIVIILGLTLICTETAIFALIDEKISKKQRDR